MAREAACADDGGGRGVFVRGESEFAAGVVEGARPPELFFLDQRASALGEVGPERVRALVALGAVETEALAREGAGLFGGVRDPFLQHRLHVVQIALQARRVARSKKHAQALQDRLTHARAPAARAKWERWARVGVDG